jgi:hypothetical protein
LVNRLLYGLRLIDADGAGLLFGRKTVQEGKEVVTKKLDL